MMDQQQQTDILQQMDALNLWISAYHRQAVSCHTRHDRQGEALAMARQDEAMAELSRLANLLPDVL